MMLIKPLLPRFAAELTGWGGVIGDQGEPLSPDFNPAEHLASLNLENLYSADRIGDTILQNARRRQGEEFFFSQYHADWYLEHWDDRRIPKDFRKAVESGEVYIVVTDTVLLDMEGHRVVLRLGWGRGRLGWDYEWLDDQNLDRKNQVLLPGHFE